jgi:hypothetical protein
VGEEEEEAAWRSRVEGEAEEAARSLFGNSAIRVTLEPKQKDFHGIIIRHWF